MRGFQFSSQSTSKNDDDTAKTMPNRYPSEILPCKPRCLSLALAVMGCYSYLRPQGWVPRSQSLSDHSHNRVTYCVPCWFAWGRGADLVLFLVVVVLLSFTVPVKVMTCRNFPGSRLDHGDKSLTCYLNVNTHVSG